MKKKKIGMWKKKVDDDWYIHLWCTVQNSSEEEVKEI
jgi:hypothetical protein